MATPNPFTPGAAPLDGRPLDPGLMPLLVRFELTSKEYRSAQLRWFARMPQMYLGLMLGGVYVSQKSFDASATPLERLLPLLFIGLTLSFVVFQTIRRFDKLPAEQKRVRYYFQPEHLEIADERSSSKIAWSALSNFSELPDALIIPRKSGHPVTLHVQVDLHSAPLRPA